MLLYQLLDQYIRGIKAAFMISTQNVYPIGLAHLDCVGNQF